MEMFEVGGCVRDEILGLRSKDIDFSVVVSEEEFADAKTVGISPFRFMASRLFEMGFEIFLETPQFLTIRARFPKGDPNFAQFSGLTADFVLARRESTYTDGRRPDVVEPGTLMDDLARRDFTMNAIAKDAQGNLIDPFGGREDIERKVIRAVGNPRDRINEDALRILRALRFSVTKGFKINFELDFAISESAHLLENVSTERIREELDKMFKADTLASMRLLTTHNQFDMIGEAIFSRGDIRLMPTMKG